MRILIDTSLLVEGERRSFDLGKWVVAGRHEVFICDATVAEYIAGKPLKEAGKEQRCRIIGIRLIFAARLRAARIIKYAKKAGELLADARRAGKPCRWATACMPPLPHWKI